MLANDASSSDIMSNAVYRSVFENSLNGIILFKCDDLTVLKANRAIVEILGYEAGELLDRNLETLIVPEEWLGTLEYINDLKNTSSPSGSMSNNYLTKSGDWIRCKVQFSIVNNHQQSILIITFQEVDLPQNDYPKIERREHEAYMLSMLNSFEGASVLLDTNRIILMTNQVMADRYELTIEELVGKNALTLFSPEIAKKRDEKFQKVIDELKEVSFEEKYGEKILLNTIRPVFDMNQKLICLAVYSLDITQKKKDQHELIIKNFAIDESINGIAFGDLNGNLFYVNKSFLRLWKYKDKNEVLGKSAFTFWKSPDQVKKVVEAIMEFGIWEGEMVATLNDSSEAIFQVSSKILADSDGKPIAMNASFLDITEAKNAEIELKSSEERLRLALQSANQGLYDLNLITGEAKVSPEYATMLGFDPLEFQETNDYWRTRLHPDDQDEVYKTYQAYINGEQHEYRVEFRQKTNTGDWKSILSVGKIVEYNANGEPLRMIGTHTDISKLNAIKREVHEGKQRLDVVISNAPIVLFSVDKQGVFTLSDGKGLELLGLKPHQVIGLSAWEMYADFPQIFEALKRAMEGETVRFTSSIGPYFFDAVYAPILDKNNVVQGVTGIGIDVTEKINAESLADQKIKELKNIIDALDQSSLVSMTDKHGIILKVNDRFCEVCGYTREELIGKSHRIINSKYHSKFFWKDLWKNISKGKIWRAEIKNRNKNGTEYWVDSVINPIMDSSGEVVNFLSIRQDITDRKIFEELLIKSHHRLAQIEKFIDVTTDAIQVSDLDGQLVYINQAASQRLGIKKDECTQYNIVDVEERFSTKDDWKKHVNELKKAGDLNVEGVHLNRETKQRIPVEISVSLVTIQDAQYVIAISRDITIRKEAEKQLLEHEERLAEAQRMANLGYWEYDLITDKVWWSEEQYKINGIKSTELPVKQQDFIDLLHPDDREDFLETFEKSLSDGSEVSKKYRIIRPDGEIRFISGSAKITKDAEGKAIRISGINLDITNTVISERALLESEQALRIAQSVAKIGSWKFDVKSNTLDWSDEAYNIFGLATRSKLTYEDFLSFVHPEDKEYVNDSWIAALKGATYDINHRIIVNNEIKWVRERAELSFDGLNKLVLGFGTVQDITDQKIIQDTNRIFNQSLFFAGLGSWRISTGAHDFFWSDNVYTLHGLVKSESVLNFDTYLETIHEDDRERILSEWIEVIRKMDSFETEYRVKVSTDQIRWLLIKGKNQFDQDGHLIEMYGIVRDITTEKQNLIELVIAKKNAEEAAKIRDEFLSVMSHEIRTPLNAVIGLSNLLMKRTPREDQLEIVKTLKSSADNLLHLVNDILDYNKIRAGKLELESRAFSLTNLLKHLHASFNIIALDKNIDFKIKSDAQIPSNLYGDVTRLNQILNNLLGNAIKFTNKGIVNLNVELKEKQKNQCIIIFKIEDTGIGIAADKLNTIFQPFLQTESNIARKFGGTGLGLSIVSALLELLNGTIYVTSTINRGSIFTVELPFKFSSSKAELHSEMNEEDSLIDSLLSNKLKILYVEDVESNRFLIENIFDDHGIKATTVASGKQALQKTKIEKFDVILMDIQMPVMDGYQTVQKIRRQVKGRNKNTPVLAFTAEPYSKKLKAKILNHEMQDVLSKPFEIERLINKINSAVNKLVPPEKIFSFLFYEEVFMGDSIKLKKIKSAIIKDLKRFYTKMAFFTSRENRVGIQEEVHRIRPILKNLKCNSLLALLEDLRASEEFTSETKKLIKTIIKHTKSLELKISKLKY